jgi:hypothetical protein
MDGKTLEQVFNENRKSRRDLPAGFAKYVWTRREVKTVQRNGVRHEGGWYYNEKMQAITGQEVELRVSIDDLGQAYIFSLAGEFLYNAVSEFADSGITEENVWNVRRLRKQAKKHLKQYQAAIREIRKDKRTQLEELRDSGGASPDGGDYRDYLPPPVIEDARELFGRGAARRHQEAASAADRPGLTLGINRSFAGGKNIKENGMSEKKE